MNIRERNLRSKFSEQIKTKDDIEPFLKEILPNNTAFERMARNELDALRTLIHEVDDIEGLGTLQLHIEQLA